jgi:hypothetical protein
MEINKNSYDVNHFSCSKVEKVEIIKFNQILTYADNIYLVIEKFNSILFSNNNFIYKYDYDSGESGIFYEGAENEIFLNLKFLENNLNDYLYILSSNFSLIEIIFSEKLVNRYKLPFCEKDTLSSVMDLKLNDSDLFFSSDFYSEVFFYCISDRKLKVVKLKNEILTLYTEFDLCLLICEKINKLELFSNNLSFSKIICDEATPPCLNTYILLNIGQIVILKQISERFEVLFKYIMNDCCNDVVLENLISTSSAYMYSLWDNNIILVHFLKDGINSHVLLNTKELEIGLVYRIFYVDEKTLLLGGEGQITFISYNKNTGNILPMVQYHFFPKDIVFGFQIFNWSFKEKIFFNTINGWALI